MKENSVDLRLIMARIAVFTAKFFSSKAVNDSIAVSETKHTVFVSKLKIAIVYIMLLLVIIIIIWSLSNVGQSAFKLTFESIGNEKSSDGRYASKMLKPRLHGVDSQKRPYSIIAREAMKYGENNLVLKKIEGDIMLKGGEWISIVSEVGNYKAASKRLELTKSVNLFIDSGYEFFTEKAYIELEKNMAAGDTDVFIQGAIGTLEAGAFAIRNNGDSIFFHKGVHLTAYPK